MRLKIRFLFFIIYFYPKSYNLQQYMYLQIDTRMKYTLYKCHQQCEDQSHEELNNFPSQHFPVKVVSEHDDTPLLQICVLSFLYYNPKNFIPSRNPCIFYNLSTCPLLTHIKIEMCLFFCNCVYQICSIFIP